MIFGFSIAILFVVLGIGSYFIYELKFPKPLYISPLGAVLGQSSKSQSEKNLLILKKFLHDQKVDYVKIVTSPAQFIVQIKDGSEIVFSSQKDMQLQTSSLQFILSRLTMEGRQFRKLDLEYNDPIIVLEK